MKSRRKEIKHYFREILGVLSVNEIMTNERLIERATRLEKQILMLGQV